MAWNLIGDAAIATSVFDKYRKKYPDRKIGVLTLKNRGNTCVDLLSPFVDEVVPILPEPWDWPEKYGRDLLEGIKEAMDVAYKYGEENGYDKVYEITMHPGMATLKGARIAMEIGVYPMDDYTPIVYLSEEDSDFGKMYTDGMKKPLVFIHAVAGNTPKSLDPEEVKIIVGKVIAENGTVIECDSDFDKRAITYKPTSIMKTAGIIKHVDQVICIDSIVLHLANALCVDTEAIFTMTSPDQLFKSKPQHINIIGI